jgi:exopolysaccharide production protein ExoZ
LERSQFLQLMRFVAAGLVLATHITFYYHERVDRSVPVWEPGGVGVPLFFMISGIVMVVASRGLPEGIEGARSFFVRRIIRIVPLWWLALSIKIAIALARPDVVNHNHFQLDHAVKSFLFIPYFTGDQAVVPLHGVGWTLLHEMYFYVLFSLALWLRIQPTLWVSVGIAGMCALGSFVHIDAAWWKVATHPANLHFVLGMALAHALLSPSWGGPKRHALAAALLLVAIALCLPPISAKVHFMYPVLLFFASATLWLAQVAVPKPLHWMVTLGDSSYSLYLFHPFIAPALVLLIARLVPQMDALWQMAMVFIGTAMLSHVLHLVAEVPIVRYARRKLSDGRASGPLKGSGAS